MMRLLDTMTPEQATSAGIECKTRTTPTFRAPPSSQDNDSFLFWKTIIRTRTCARCDSAKLIAKCTFVEVAVKRTM